MPLIFILILSNQHHHPLRGEICHYPNCWRQCNIFANGVNFSIFTQFFVFLSPKLLKFGKSKGVKFMAWKSGGVKYQHLFLRWPQLGWHQIRRLSCCENWMPAVFSDYNLRPFWEHETVFFSKKSYLDHLRPTPVQTLAELFTYFCITLSGKPISRNWGQS